MKNPVLYRNRRRDDHIIYAAPQGSYAAYLLFKRGLALKDNSYGISAERLRRIEFNHKFAKKILRIYGELHCVYCGRDDLTIHHWKEFYHGDDVATVDHFLPKSVYPLLVEDESNLFICCKKCNEEKGDKIWSKDTIKFPYKKN